MSDKIIYKPLTQLREAWRSNTPSVRLQALRKNTPYLRGHMLGEGGILGVKTFDLVTVPYPSSMGFSGAALSPAPYLLFTNRVNIIQFLDHDGDKKTILFNPTNYEASARTPFFYRLSQRYGDFLSNKVMTKRHNTVLGALQSLGISPEEVDYIAYDHQHTQDLRGVLGTEQQVGWFPKAKLLIQRVEWETTQNLHPLQSDWYIAEGTQGISSDRVVLLDGDVSLGKGVALISTPGHTYGNQTLAVCLSGTMIFTVSENGVAADSYAPLRSKIPGLTTHARNTGQEVILNGNTREATLDQYNSMIIEKILAGPSPVDPDICNHIPSSELTASPLAPMLSPTFFHGPLMFGEVSSSKNGVVSLKPEVITAP
jgi:glyoxylase-like metal-dependent hydrolase (beta-lactamase superfamily II)